MENHAIEYKKLRGKARRVVKDAKRESRRKFCSTLGPQTEVRKLWALVHRMAGVYRTSTVPILQSEGQEAVDSKAKTDLLVKTVHSSENISPASKKKREEKLKNENFKL